MLIHQQKLELFFKIFYLFTFAVLQRGYIKKTPLADFASLTARGLIIITLEPDDSLRWVKRCFQSDSVIIGTEQVCFIFDDCSL